MSALIVALFSALCSTQTSAFSQNIKDLHLHAKIGEGLLEHNPPRKHLNLVDEYASEVAKDFVMKYIIPKDPTQFKAMYGPIENIVIPGIKLPRPITLTNIRVTGLKRLHMDDLQWRMESNRVTCNATVPLLLLDVTFDNVQIELGKYFNDEQFINTIRLSIRLMGLTIDGSARYNVKPMHSDPNEPNFYIDKAEVDIYARDVLYEINVLHGLEEVRYILAELMNNPIEDIMGGVLKVVVKEINKELLSNVDPDDITNYLISKVPKNSKVPKELIAIKSLAVF